MKTKILLVEDEQDTADLLKNILEREGFSVFQAKNGRQAEILIETIRPLSLVLLDMVIPYVSGLELLRIIRHHPDWQEVPVIMLSADSYEPDIQRALDEGATAYVTKQKGTQALLQVVRQFLPLEPAPDQMTAKASISSAPHEMRATPKRPRCNQGSKRAA